MKQIDLYNNNLTELSESNLTALCHLNGFKPNELEYLNLHDNKLSNLNFIQENTSFINLKILYIGLNKITDINCIKYLLNLEYLNIINLKLDNEKETIKILKNMPNLKNLYCKNTFKLYSKSNLKKQLLNITIYD